MNELTPFASQAISIAGHYRFVLLFIGAIVEGPVLMVVCGALVHLGYLSLGPTFLTLALGDLTGDVVWYWVGNKFLASLLEKRGRFFSVTPQMFAAAQELFRRYHLRILIISKITLGFGMALGTLMAAGASHVPFRKYMSLNVLGEVFLVAMLMALGYSFSQLAAPFGRGLHYAFLTAAALIIGAAMYGFSKYARSVIMRHL